MLRNAGGHVRIQGFDVRAVAQQKNFISAGDFHPLRAMVDLVFKPDRSRSEDPDDKNSDEPVFHGRHSLSSRARVNRQPPGHRAYVKHLEEHVRVLVGK